MIKKEMEEETPRPPEVQPSCCRSETATVVLLLFGFYFLAFAIAEFITNTQQSQYQWNLTCTNNNCSAVTESLRFDTSRDVQVYITTSLPQNRISVKGSYSPRQMVGNNNGQNDAVSCRGYLTNREIGKSVSITGKPLNPQEKSIPCGLLPLSFPLGIFDVYSTETNIKAPIRVNQITAPVLKLVQNIDPDRQWLDLSDPRFTNWMDISPSKQTRKLWGILPGPVAGTYRIEFILASPPISSYSVTFTDGKATGGLNLPLCIFCFVASLVSFSASIVNFVKNVQAVSMVVRPPKQQSGIDGDRANPHNSLMFMLLAGLNAIGRWEYNKICMNQRQEADLKLPSFLEFLLLGDEPQGAAQCFGSAAYKLKFKTEMCRYWAATGSCPYYKSCAFAHGPEELRRRCHLPRNYKTKVCANFQQGGHCKYGSRCRFVHPQPKPNAYEMCELGPCPCEAD